MGAPIFQGILTIRHRYLNLHSSTRASHGTTERAASLSFTHISATRVTAPYGKSAFLFLSSDRKRNGKTPAAPTARCPLGTAPRAQADFRDGRAEMPAPQARQGRAARGPSTAQGTSPSGAEPRSPAAAAWGKRSSNRTRGKMELRDERSLSQQWSGAGCRARSRCPPGLSVRTPGGTGGGEGSDPPPCPALPSRPGGSRGGSYLWRSWGRLGGGGIPLPGPRLGAPLRASLSGRSELRGAGAWLMAAAGTMRGGRCGGREEWVTEREEGGRDGGRGPAPQATALSPPLPPQPTPAGLATAGQEPCGCARPAEGCRYRPGAASAARSRSGTEGAAGAVAATPGEGTPTARPTPSSVGRTCRETSGPAAGHRVFTCASFGRASQMTRGAKVALLVADSGNVPSRASCFLRKVSASAALRTTRRSLPCLRRDAGTAGLLSKFTFMRGKERRWAGRSLSPYLAEPLKWVQKATTCDGKT